jgi:CheY-like chemotaxis protein
MEKFKNRRNLLLRCEYTLGLNSARKGSDSRDPAGRARIVAILVVTGEIVLMAVILIVEDDMFLRDDAEMMIQDWGHDTLSASDVDEALSLLRSPQQIDALFTDIYLKKAVLGGYELAHQAIKLRRNLRVLYTTGNTINDEMKAVFVGAHFLQKPYTQHQLQNFVEKLLAA